MQEPFKRDSPHFTVGMHVLSGGRREAIATTQGAPYSTPTEFGPLFRHGNQFHNVLRSPEGLSTAQVCSFDLAELPSGLPEVKAMFKFNHFHDSKGNLSIDERGGLRVHARIQERKYAEGTSQVTETDWYREMKGNRHQSCTGFQPRLPDQGGGSDLLLAKKIVTLVLILEETLLIPLVDPTRAKSVKRVEVSLDKVIDDIPFGSSFFDSIPPAEAMKPSAWNKSDPEHLYGIFHMLWFSARMSELDRCLVPWRAFELGTSRVAMRGFHLGFSHLQTTFDPVLVRNWCEVIGRIIELAMAVPEEYRKCLETIFEIQHDADQGGKAAWERLMKDVLNFEHRIPEWKNQIATY